MIAFDRGPARFNYRIVGIALHNNQVLLHKAVHERFWALPGGRAEMLESATETLRREMREELGLAVQVERLVWIVEDFYWDAARKTHELALYFLMSLPPDCALYTSPGPFKGQEEHNPLIFQWFPCADLEQITLYPTFLQRALKSLPAGIEHIVIDETS
ncbi:MAG: NUDIX hydrolase [Ktedonobacteraceae bacterium]